MCGSSRSIASLELALHGGSVGDAQGSVWSAVRLRRVWLMFESDVRCHVSLNASVSFLVWKCVVVVDRSGRAYVVLLTELLGERGAHDGAADAGRGREVRLARLSSGRRQSCGGRGSV